MTARTTAIAPYLIGSSSAMTELRALIGRFAATDIPVLIQGPTGSGKELVARALHEASARSGALVPVNVCAMADTMVEDTLFGHVRGAFTGAASDSAGYLAEANGGTLFLDEIGGLQPASQLKLLRALELGSFRPVGASRDRVSRFRTVAATNEDLVELVEERRFRLDLLHRLSGVVLRTPPLRDRPDDIPELAEFFRSEFDPAIRPASIGSAAINRLREHRWPGNVRELRHVIRRACVFEERDEIGVAAVQRAIAGDPAGSPAAYSQGFPERRLRELLEECAWDTARAASELGVHRATVYRRMERMGIVVPAGVSLSVSEMVGRAGRGVAGQARGEARR
jgi:DNA-binding NtrC family response regulator